MNKTALYAIPLLFVTMHVNATETQQRVTEGIVLAGWEDRKTVPVPRKTTSYPLSRIEQLERENEQLRNSITQMRRQLNAINPAAGANETGKKNAQIQALIEENNRLTKRVMTMEKAARTSGASTDSRAVKALKKEVDQVKRSNEQLRSALAQRNSEAAASAEMQTQINALSANLQSLEQENKTLKASLLSQQNQIAASQGSAENEKRQQSQIISSLQSELETLKKENKNLNAQIASTDRLLSQTTQLANTKKDKEAELLQQVATLNAQLGELSKNNSTLQTQIASKDTLLNEANKKANLKSQGQQEVEQKLAALQAELAQLTQNNSALQTQIAAKDAQLKEANKTAQSKTQTKKQFDQKIADLQAQNESLRQTIKAQNEVLVSADNSTQAAERLMSENLALKQQLEQASKSNQSSSDTTQDLMALNQKLQTEITKRDNYIAQLEPLKETVKALQAENSQVSQAAKTNQASSFQVRSLQAKLTEAEQALEKEKIASKEYRKKIREYQEQVGKVASGKPSAQNTQMNAILLENQNLKARIELLKGATQKLESQSSVKYVETSYPKVDDVRPLLNKDGQRISKAETNIATENAQALKNMNPEDLLSMELKPLSNAGNK